MRNIKRKALFLEKDGPLMRNVPFNTQTEDLIFAEEAFPGLRYLQVLGFDIYIVTNQPGFALGKIKEVDFFRHRHFIEKSLAQVGIYLSGFHYCPHHPEVSTCLCHKPEPGMLHEIAQEDGIDMSASWVIGDVLDDVEAAHRANTRAILIQNGQEKEWRLGPQRIPDRICRNLYEAVWSVIESVHRDEQLYAWTH